MLICVITYKPSTSKSTKHVQHHNQTPIRFVVLTVPWCFILPRRAGALEALLENALAEDASAETRSACVFSLANLAAPPKYHNLFIPAVPHLLHLLDSYDQVQRV